MDQGGLQMIAVSMEPGQVKGFMGRLLREDVLDEFEMRGIEIGVTTRISINGAVEVAESPSEEDAPAVKTPTVYITWEAMRPLVYSIIKLSSKPKFVKIIFSYKAQEATTIHANAAALFLNMVYESDTVSFTTATSQKEFALDKSMDDTWDDWVRGFFVRKNIMVTDRE